MACESLQEDLQAYLDGELAPPRRAALEAHLRECDECNRVIDELQQVSGALSRWKDRDASDRFEFMLQFKLSTENLPSEETASTPAAVEPEEEPAGESETHVSLVRWLRTGWRPAAAIAASLLALVAVVALNDRGTTKRVVRRRAAGDMVQAFLEAGPNCEISDACIYAASAGKHAIEADNLNPAKVASSDVVYSFLASTESPAEKSAGWRLVNFLSEKTPRHMPPRQAAMASKLSLLQGMLFSDVYAATRSEDPLADGRRYELQGRLREALARYSEIVSGPDAPRARLAEGAVNLRLGALDAAVESLTAARQDGDSIVRSAAATLLSEVNTARKARQALVKERQTAKTAADWYAVGIMEIRAYDFRSAANSLMKAANSAAEDDITLRLEARYRSAWCQKEVGQISTAVYGFRTIAGDDAGRDTLGYAAAISEAVSLSRVGRFQESVNVCRELLKTTLPEDARELESLAYFHKGCVELRHLNNINAAAESLGRVASGGQGNLSFAAQYLLEARGR